MRQKKVKKARQVLVKNRNELISLSKEKKLEVLDKAWLILRENDFPFYLKPIRLRSNVFCAVTQEKILAGDYAYPCHVNPFKLSPYGTHRVKIEAIINSQNKTGGINQYLPANSIGVQIPSTEAIYSRSNALKTAMEQHNKALSQQASTLLLKG